MNHIVREAIEIELHPYSINKEGSFCLSKSWMLLIGTFVYVQDLTDIWVSHLVVTEAQKIATISGMRQY
jgi:hypothetical protein